MATMHFSARSGARLALVLGAGLFTLGVFTASLAQAAPRAAKADDRGSEADQRACTPDVFRLCMSAIPNEPRIVACLIRSKRDLSPACRSVFNRASPATQQARNAPRRAAPKKASARKSPRPARVTSTWTRDRETR